MDISQAICDSVN